MWVSSGMACSARGWWAHWRTSDHRRQNFVLLLLTVGWLAPVSARADGCFVFKWNKGIDINEPTQKAIIIHDAGRQDMLLQVKYEGPLEEFGWLIPVPSLPKVEKGSMEPFYELSELTQRRFGTRKTLSAGGPELSSRGAAPEVKVIEIKTVGAYEVAILSANDSGALANWLKAHDYSLPEGKSEIVDDYIRRDWYFIAAKIELNKGSAFKTASATGPTHTGASLKARATIQKQLSSGELHPLLISFDTPKGIFPLKISAINGTPSEVSLYVLSDEPLLERSTFRKASEKLESSYGDWSKQKDQNSDARARSMQNLRAIQLASMMYAENSNSRSQSLDRRRTRNWTTEDLNALAAEATEAAPDGELHQRFYGDAGQLLHCLRLEASRIPKTSKVFARLQNRDWHLTKLTRTFAPAEMQDLEFEPAIPVLAQMLSKEHGSVAAQLLAELDPAGMPALLAACKSLNSTERLNAIGALEYRSAVPPDILTTLLGDDSPQVRLHAARCAELHWDARFTQPLIALLHDPHIEIRQEAIGCLSGRESTNRTFFYLGLLNDPNPHVRASALAVAAGINRIVSSDEVFSGALQMLKDPSEDVQSIAVGVLLKSRRPVSKSDLLPLLNHPHPDTVAFIANLLRGGGRIRYVGDSLDPSQAVLSADLAPLMTNRFGNVRLIGLRAMQDSGDATAVELTLHLLRDTNSVIRSRAFSTLQAIIGQNISDDDPAKWETWWAANKSTFKPHGNTLIPR